MEYQENVTFYIIPLQSLKNGKMIYQIIHDVMMDLTPKMKNERSPKFVSFFHITQTLTVKNGIVHCKYQKIILTPVHPI